MEAQAKPGTVIYDDLPLTIRVMRDLLGSRIEKVRIDSRESHQRVKTFCEQFMPDMETQLEYYPGERPIFDIYGIEDEIQKALQRKVQLKSGGYLILDQTEAMTTVDVNTGGYVGHRNLEETIFKTNLEAAQAIARQLRLRNLGGIIIIDFIDMSDEEHKRQVLRALEKHLEKDHAKTQISEVSVLGLVEMTRKRTRESLEHILCETCPTCDGRASLKTPETVCYEIFREILREARQYDAQQLLVLASQEVVDLLLDEESDSLADLEAFIGKPIKFQVESLYTQEQYDVVPM
jgi:ribonuclease G